MSASSLPTIVRVAYEQDLAAWADEQARLLRGGHFAGLDLEHLAEEIESLGASQRRELHSRLAVLLHHLLKWRFQPAHRSPSWRRTLRTQRRDVERLLKGNPSLRRTVSDVVTEAYDNGLTEAVRETGFGGFPELCPWSASEVMSPEFHPD